MANLLEIKPEEKQLELGGELGVGEQVVQGVEVPQETKKRSTSRSGSRKPFTPTTLGKIILPQFYKIYIGLGGKLETLLGFTGK